MIFTISMIESFFYSLFHLMIITDSLLKLRTTLVGKFLRANIKAGNSCCKKTNKKIERNIIF